MVVVGQSIRYLGERNEIAALIGANISKRKIS
jgi:hypothetical protein